MGRKGGGRKVHVLTYTNLTCVHAGLDLSVACADMSWMGAGWTFLLHVQTCHGWVQGGPYSVACADMSWVGCTGSNVPPAAKADLGVC